MLKREIAGNVITYKTPEELNGRIRETLETIQGRRVNLEQECKLLRLQEKILERSLGGPKTSKSTASLKENVHA